MRWLACFCQWLAYCSELIKKTKEIRNNECPLCCKLHVLPGGLFRLLAMNLIITSCWESWCMHEMPWHSNHKHRQATGSHLPVLGQEIHNKGSEIRRVHQVDWTRKGFYNPQYSHKTITTLTQRDCSSRWTSYQTSIPTQPIETTSFISSTLCGIWRNGRCTPPIFHPKPTFLSFVPSALAANFAVASVFMAL